MRQIKDYPSYFVTERGEVFSNKTQTLRKLKSFQKRGNKYSAVTLCEASNCKQHLIHRLVAQAFLPYASQPFVLHNDGDKTNNCVDNLRYGTPSDNTTDASRHGTLASRKLTNEQVVEIFNSTSLQKELGYAYDVDDSVISDIKTGMIYSWLTGKKYTRKKKVH